MDLSVLVRGLAIGFGIAAPVGPIGILCIRRTLADGRAVGFAAGLGAATADALYGARLKPKRLATRRPGSSATG